MPRRKPNLAVHQHFDRLVVENAVSKRVRCKFCGWEHAENATRMADHLLGCLGYQSWIEVQKEGEPVLKRQRTLDGDLVIRIPDERKKQIDIELAQCIFQTGRPLSLFDHPCWKEFFQQNFGYTPPDRHRISEDLLSGCYNSMKKDTLQKLSASSSLSLVTDESTDISKNRIINTSVVLPSGKSIYWSNIEAQPGKMGAEELGDHLLKTANDITGGQLSKIVSITTDTCSTMDALKKRLEKTLGLEHTLMVPCDSHGLQLLIKDILYRPDIKNVWTTATAIVNGLRNSPKQYAFLKEEQRKIYKKEKALLGAVITRWGSQVGMLQSLMNTKEALREFADRLDVDFPLKTNLQLSSFWFAIQELLELLEPIHKAQKMSEDNKANISYVYQRWLDLEAHLRSYSKRSSLWAKDVKAYLETTPIPSVKLTGIDKKNWTRRRDKQVIAIHHLAFYLHPKNHAASMSPDQERKIVSLFKHYTSDYKVAYEDFLDFRKQESDFGPLGWLGITQIDQLFSGDLWRYPAQSCPHLQDEC